MNKKLIQEINRCLFLTKSRREDRQRMVWFENYAMGFDSKLMMHKTKHKDYEHINFDGLIDNFYMSWEDFNEEGK